MLALLFVRVPETRVQALADSETVRRHWRYGQEFEILDDIGRQEFYIGIEDDIGDTTMETTFEIGDFVLRISKFGVWVKRSLKQRRWASLVHRLIS